LWDFSIIAGGVVAFFAAVVLSKGCFYAGKVIRLFVYVSLVKS
jgi:hypothetical protein